ncbi:MAG: response regulator [SAR324 cluster bacterium]|nr:response regulator [SAR324 cluster bacterium]
MSEGESNTLSIEIQHLPMLVVESNSALQKAIVNALGGAGVKHCQAASNGAEAWQVWKNASGLGLVIASWSLPEMAGMELLKRLRGDKDSRLQPAFVMMTSEATPDALMQAMQAGADCFVVKPFAMGDLVSLVTEAVAHRKQVAGQDVFTESLLEAKELEASVRVQLLYDRSSELVECDSLSGTKCCVLTPHNFGLGSNISLRFGRRGVEPAQYYQNLKGIVTKMERVSGQPGMYRVHVQFSAPAQDEHGVKELLLSGGGA